MAHIAEFALYPLRETKKGIAHPPGLGLSCPQPDADHPARWVRFLAPRSWA